MRDRVGGPVGRQQERRHLGLARVVRGSRPELEKVERGERSQEEWQPPQWAASGKQQCGRRNAAGGERNAQTKSSQRDARQRLGLARQVESVRGQGLGALLGVWTENREEGVSEGGGRGDGAGA